MSAYVVADEIINRVVNFIARDRNGDWIRRIILTDLSLNLETPTGRKQLGKSMFKLNCSAVEARYGDGSASGFRPLDYKYSPMQTSTERIQVYKHLKSFMYQCNEGSVPEESLLYATLQRIQGEMADDIVCALPQYDRAEW